VIILIVPVDPTLRKMRQEDYKNEASLGYRKRPCLKQQQQQKESQKTTTKNILPVTALQFDGLSSWASTWGL
jgi:hypothetical protein